jgi:hypothetical protein
MKVEFANGDDKTIRIVVTFDNGDEDVESYSSPIGNCCII